MNPQPRPTSTPGARRRGALLGFAALALVVGIGAGLYLSPASSESASSMDAAVAPAGPTASTTVRAPTAPAVHAEPSATALPKGEHALVGRVLASASLKPLAGARVWVAAYGSDAGSALELVADQAGTIRVPGLAQGLFLVTAAAPGYRRDEAPCLVPSTEEDRPCEVLLAGAPTLEGKVLDERGAPVAEAEVLAVANGGHEETFSALSAADGTFLLTAEIGFFTVLARKGPRVARLAEVQSLRDDSHVSGLVLTLRAAAALVGRVTSATTGEPLPGVTLSVTDDDDSAYHLSSLEYRAQAVTADDGSYAVEGLSAGVYAVTASAEGSTPVTRGGIGLTSGARFTADFELSGTGGVEGFVRDGAGRGVAGVQVLLETERESTRSATSGEDGHYLLERIPAGEATVSATSVAARFYASALVTVVPDAVSHLDLGASKLATVHGHVLEADGQPSRERVTVSTVPDSEERQAWTTEARLDGSYRLELAASGTVWLAARAGETKDGRSVRAYLTDLVPGETRQVDLKLPSQAERDPVVLAEGTVLEPSGEPSLWAEISARYERSVDSLYAFADGDGHFQVESLDETATPGTLVIEARNKGRTGKLRGVAVGSRGVVLRLSAAARLQGRVISQAPVESFKVSVQGLAGSPAAASAEFSGDTFVLEELPPGQARIAVTTPTAAAGDALVQLAAGETTPVEIVLREVGQVSGRAVASADRAPLSACDVTLRPQGGEAAVADASTDPDGRFHFEAVGAGSYTALVECGAANAYGARAFRLEPGQSLDVGDLALVAPAPGRIGIQFAGETRPVVALVEAGSPAEQAGVLAGDVIVSVDGAPLYTVTEALLKVRGEAGTPLRLGVKRDEKELAFDLVRARLDEP